jgi:hypothetical protein
MDKGILKVRIWKIESVGYVCLRKVDSVIMDELSWKLIYDVMSPFYLIF